MRAFSARFGGTCHICQGSFDRGDSITWSRAQKGHYAHVSCYQKNPPTETQAVTQSAKVNDSVTQFEAKPATSDSDSILELIAEAVENRLRAEDTKPSIDEEAVTKIVDERIAAMPQFTFVEVKRPSGEVIKVDGPQHKRFPELLYYLGRREHVYMWGPTQSGKSTGAELAADALGLPYYYLSLNPQTPDSRLMGYNDANGREIQTVFRKAYENGGVACLDEADNSSASLLTTLNSALANAHGSFPSGMVKRHENFVCVCTGNTPGRGGTPDYPERRSLDGAFAQRFRYLEWGYDEALEHALTVMRSKTAAEPVLSLVRTIRALAKQKGWKIQASPTCSMGLAAYAEDGFLSVGAALDALLFKGIDTQTRDAAIKSVEQQMESLNRVWGKGKKNAD